MAALQQIHSPAGADGKPHIIFVHGLGGDIRETWMCNPADHTTLWPAWVGEDTGCPVWLLGYDAALSAWTEVAMALPQQGINVLDTLVSEPRLKGAPLVMVGHSLGGLVIKMALANAVTQGVKRYEQFAQQLRGVAFVGTPHFGSELATLASAVALLRANEQVGNLRANDAYLLTLNAQFRDLYSRLGFRVRVFTETRGVTIRRKVFGMSIWPRQMVVVPSSGDPSVPGEVAIPLAEDHFSICKPINRQAQIHRSLVDFIAEVEAAMAAASAPATPAASAAPLPPAPVPAPAAAAATPAEPRVTHAAIDAGAREPLAVHLALALLGLDAPGPGIAACALLTTDEPQALVQRIGQWRDQLSRDPLVPAAERARASSASLQQLVLAPATRSRLLAWLAVTPFSAYVYYGSQASLASLEPAERERRLLVEPLVHRLSKKDERVVRVRSDVAAIDAPLATALNEVQSRFHRGVAPPKTSGHDAASLLELAQLVAWASAEHLGHPDDAERTAVFDSLRTRIRFAEDVVVGTKHLRDKNPLP